MNSRLGQITIFQDTFRMLSENIQAWGANANVASVLATLIMAIVIVFILLLVLAVLRSGFKGRIKEMREQCETIKLEQEKSNDIICAQGKQGWSSVLELGPQRRTKRSSRIEGELVSPEKLSSKSKSIVIKPEIAERIISLSDEALLDMLNKPDNYLPEAIAFARDEVARRLESVRQHGSKR